MKNNFLVLFNFLAVLSLAQQGFYVSPIFQKKWVANHQLPFDIYTKTGTVVQIKPKNFYSPRGFDIGLSVGYRKRNHFIDLTWTSDMGSQGFHIIHPIYFPKDSSIFYSYAVDYSAVIFNKYSLRYGVRLLGRDSISTGKKNRCELFLFGALDFFSRPPIPAKIGYGVTSKVDNLGHILLEETFSSTALRWGSGFTLGIMLKVFNKNNRPLFNLSAQYLQGGRYNQLSYTLLTITDYSGSKYTHTLFSKGSGFYINLSHDFYYRQYFKKKKVILH
jgi:hypothetical protein